MKRILLILGLLGLSGVASAVEAPNLYECKGKNLKVSYSTSGLDGKATFSATYSHNPEKNVSARGQDILVTSVVLGGLVSIQARYIPDLVVSYVSLAVPGINLPTPASLVEFNTVFIETNKYTTIIGPDGVKGVVDRSNYIQVNCIAKHVDF